MVGYKLSVVRSNKKSRKQRSRIGFVVNQQTCLKNESIPYFKVPVAISICLITHGMKCVHRYTCVQRFRIQFTEGVFSPISAIDPHGGHWTSIRSKNCILHGSECKRKLKIAGIQSMRCGGRPATIRQQFFNYFLFTLLLQPSMLPLLLVVVGSWTSRSLT